MILMKRLYVAEVNSLSQLVSMCEIQDSMSSIHPGGLLRMSPMAASRMSVGENIWSMPVGLSRARSLLETRGT